MKKIKKLVAVMLLSLTLFNTTFNSYTMAVQAAQFVPVTMTVLEAVLAMFGLQMGLGNQKNFMTNSEVTDFVSAVANGGTVTMPHYSQEINFSDGESVLAFMQWAQSVYGGIRAGNNLTDVASAAGVLSFAKLLDSVSYKNSGTSATDAMEDSVNSYVESYGGSAQTVADELRSTFTVINGGASSGNDNDDDDDNNMTTKRWGIFTAVMSALLLGASEVLDEFSDSLSVPEETEFDEFGSMDEEGFNFNKSYSLYSNTADPKYESYKHCYVVGRFGYPEASEISGCMICPRDDVFSVIDENGIYSFYYYDEALFKLVSDNCIIITYYADKEKYYYSSDPIFNSTTAGLVTSLYMPVFTSEEGAKAYILEGDTSGVINLDGDLAYGQYKELVKAPQLGGVIGNLMDTNPTPDELAEIVPAILEQTDGSAGTSSYIPEIEEAIGTAAGIDSEGETDSGTDNSLGYMGILERILAAIQFFNNPFETILTNWQNLIQWLCDFGIWLGNAWVELQASIAAPEFGPSFGSIDGSSSDGSGSSFKNFLNGLMILIYIFFILLRIFLHLLEFIINIFRIPADPGFITGDFAIGFDYIKSVQLSPLNMSIYDFLMGLVHILLLFSVVKVLKRHIDRIHL